MEVNLMQSFAKVDKHMIIAAANNYLKYHSQWMIDLEKDARAKLAVPYKHWFKFETRTQEEINDAIEYAEDYENNGWGWDINHREPAVKAKWLQCGNEAKRKSKSLIKLAINSLDCYVYLTASDNDFVSEWKNYKEEK